VSWRRFLNRGRWDDERARELDAHLAFETDDNLARGMSPAEARDAARRKLGNVTQIREEIYRMNTVGILDTIWQDLRYGVRLLRLNPGFAIVAILSLALGVGANTAIFQLLNAVRLRALPVSHPEQLAEVRIVRDGGRRSGGFDGSHPAMTNVLWEHVRDRQDAFSDIFAWGTAAFELAAGGEGRRAQGVWVSGDYFRTLRVRPIIGRLITAEDDRRGCAAPPAVIGYGFWQQEYGGSPSVLGRQIVLDGHAYDIAGVAPPGFFGVEVGRTIDVAVPLCAEPFSRRPSSLDRKENWFLGVIGRLKPDWTLQRATAHLAALSPPLFKETLPHYSPEDEKAYLAFTLGAVPAGTGVSELRNTYEAPLWLLLAITALVLFIACANLANLMLARATAREREIAVRLALGASRTRIVRQLLAESLLIAAAGATAGAVLAQSLSRVLVAALGTSNRQIVMDVAGDARVFGFIALVAAAACVIFGLVPAIRATATSPGAVMKAGGRGSTDSRERFGLRRLLVVAQVALSLLLVVGALLFVRSFRNLVATDAGFARQNLMITALDFRRTGLVDDRLRSAYADLLDRVRHDPAVEDAAMVRNVPVGGSFSNRTVIVDGAVHKDVNYNAVSDRYFSTMASALLAGRDFDLRDAATAPRVAIVTQSFARVVFGGQNPIGRIFQIEQPPGVAQPAYEIVGLARDSKYGDLRDPFEPLIYVPVQQDDRIAGSRLVVRSRGSLSAATAAVTAYVRELHPSIVINFRTMDAQLSDSVIVERLMATLSGFFGALAALIAMIGLYGVVSYSVARRRNEIGIRMALGADRVQIVRMVMREAATLLAAGLAVGTVSALAAARSARALLFGLTPHDPLTLATAAAALAAVAALASYVPARRASRLEPTEALRDE
jgi:putative ABC transport system permease protein